MKQRQPDFMHDLPAILASRMILHLFWCTIACVAVLICVLAMSRTRPHAVAQDVYDTPPTSQPFTKDYLWVVKEGDSVSSVAFGDYNNDGWLDLAVAVSGYKVRLYQNTFGEISSGTTWEVDADVQDVAWGDVDNDGDVDLAMAGGTGGANQVYMNEQGTLATTAGWSSSEIGVSSRVAWGDYNGDGYLDLAVANQQAPVRLYQNQHGSLTTSAVWSSTETTTTLDLAWADVDSDGDLDLVVAANDRVRLYRNDSGTLTSSAIWVSEETGDFQSVAWGDYDNDGDPDLVAGGEGTTVLLYRNNGGVLTQNAAWSSLTTDSIRNLAWGDYDGDGDLDLAVGIYGNVNRLYRNDSEKLVEVWNTPSQEKTQSVAWGDVDNDGDLDLAVGNDQFSRVYRNSGSGVSPSPSQMVGGTVVSMAWAELVGDDALSDLVAATNIETDSFAINVYQNKRTTIDEHQSWHLPPGVYVTSLALGDYDNDGDYDLAVGTMGAEQKDADGYYTMTGQSNMVFRNDNGTFDTVPVWISHEQEPTNDIAWGDVDDDGYLDLAVANGGSLEFPTYAPNRIYHNHYGVLQPQGVYWESTTSDDSRSVAWADYNSDGDMDIAFGNNGANLVYFNDRGALPTDSAWQSQEEENTTSVAWVDYDGDGDLDLSSGNANSAVHVHSNNVSQLTNETVWESAENDQTKDLAWGDYDGDGDMDLATVNTSQPTRLYRNDCTCGSGMKEDSVWWSSESAGLQDDMYDVEWLDYDDDGDLDLVTARDTGIFLYLNARDARNSFNPLPLVHVRHPAVVGIKESEILNIRYTLTHSDSLPVREISATFSLDGGGYWLPAQPTSTTVTTNLSTSPTGFEHDFNWDVFASGFTGQSDHVIFRIQAIPDLNRESAAHHTPGPYQRGSYTAATDEFRVRGTQIQVVYNSEPVSNALVFRLAVGKSGKASAYSGSDGTQFRTDQQGYLQGRGTLSVGDQLTALVPVTTTDSYTIYRTNSKPSESGLQAHMVDSAKGVEVINVSDETTLVIFNLVVSLEWDARYDSSFISQLKSDLLRASEYLYEWTNGQAVLGTITLYHNRQNWDDADVVIYATNSLRPNANQGGIVTEDTTDPDNTDVTYYAGQVRMGAVWNRNGDSSGNVGEDWPRTLTHELGHYLLFLDDNYIGLNDDGSLTSVDTCRGAMSNPYRKDYGAFHPNADWLPECEESLSYQITGRSDWNTITTFYPSLKAPTSSFDDFVDSLPNVLPLDVTEITEVYPDEEDDTLDVTIFNIVDSDNSSLNPESSSQAFLFKAETEAEVADWYDYLVDLGAPSADQITARGISADDRLCLYDTEEQVLGCSVVSNDSDVLTVVSEPDWQPDILVTPVTSTTITISVTNVTQALSLTAQLYQRTSDDDAASDRLNLYYDDTTLAYVGTLDLNEAALSGFIHIWVDEDDPRREVITSYSLGGSPAPGGGSGSNAPGGGSGSNAPTGKGYASPAVSSDGQVILFGNDLDFDDGEFYTLQTATKIPSYDPWLSVIGDAYHLTATDNAPNLEKASISITYLEDDVPDGLENWIIMYFWDGQTWTRLDSSLDTDENMVSAPVQGKGLYVLMATVDIELSHTGWNLFSYPVQNTQTVTKALQSINDSYTTIYGYEWTGGEVWEGFSLYDKDVPDWVNTLETMTFGTGYWINVTQPVTVSLYGVISTTESLASAIPSPPATYYDTVQASGDFVPTAGMTVTAWISPTLCGETQVQEQDDTLVFAIHVAPEAGGKQGCGTLGKSVTFQVDTHLLTQTVVWDNSRPQNLMVASGEKTLVYLPIVTR